MWTFLDITRQSGDPSYRNFTRKYCDFIRQNLYYFNWQYYSLHAFRGSYHRIFRRTMLDDTGAPVLPFVALYLQDNNDQYLDVINPIAEYVISEQMRLDDGTLCRPEPERRTVWADDLFMSVPFLVRMAKISNQQTYYDEAADQIIRFYQRLFDEENKLCYHGWFSSDNRHSVALWGRANGWMIWALSEALLYIPQAHPAYHQIMDIYRQHISGLIACQGVNGLWHQVLDHPESYEETSCTAMYTLALARGVKMAWLPEEYKIYIDKAWAGLKSKISRNGTVSDICRGTGIGENLEFYFQRQRFDHDPRGLGAVITAALEVDRLGL
jgi:rhamnogalacturonyl hydrolase YesR